MKSVFFRRLLIVMIIVMMIITFAMALGSGLMGEEIYKNIKLEEMLPKGQAVASIVTEYSQGNISGDTLIRLAESYVKDEEETTIVFNAYHETVFAVNAPENEEWKLDSEALNSIYTRVLSNETVSEQKVDVDGMGEAIAAAVPISNDNGDTIGGVVILQPTRAVSEAMGSIRRMIYTFLCVGTLLMMGILSGYFHHITEPLHDMSEVAIKMSGGNFDIRANEGAEGEVGLLARALNNLCETLSGTIYQLRFEKGQLDELLQSLTDGVVAMDGSGELTHYNTAIMGMFGVVNVEKRQDLIADPMVWKAFDEVFITGESQSINYPTTGERVLLISVSPVHTDEGVRTGVVGLFKDITEMERTEKMRREYVANVSHELRTPLTAVRGLLEPLADGMVKDEESRQRYYKIMLHEVMRLSRLITDMLTLSRLQAGTEYMELSRVNLEELINDVAISYAAAAQQKGISLEVDCIPAADALTDPDRIEQVLIILLDNAMHYTPQGGKITLRLRSGERLLVSVEDNGCGIPEKDIPFIFERFYKVDKSRGEGGTGLGLSIASYIMEKLDETITVDSKVGEGTCFTFTVKRYVSNAIELGPANAAAKAKNREDMPNTESVGDKEIYDADYEIVRYPIEEKSKKGIGIKKSDGKKKR